MSELYSKTHPFITSIKQRYPLSKPGSKKDTQHVIIDLKESGITYNVGDCIGIYPINDPFLVLRTLDALKFQGDEIVNDQHGQEITIKDFLTYKANISAFSRKFLSELSNKQIHPEKKSFLENLLAEGNREGIKLYMNNHQLWDALKENPEVKWTPTEIVSLLMPLLPRLYSIASAQEAVGDEVHLTVSNLKYETNELVRHGVCTHYLCDLVPIGQCSVQIYPYPQHHGFTIPENPDAAIIMVGPGTGVAPYRGFLQARAKKGHRGKNWLIFGEWNSTTDFFYEDEWKELQKQIPLKVDTAFSRDQTHKIYVQNRMLDQAQEFYQWLENGAYFYVCGDATRMAKDVEAALHKIIEEQGKKTPEEAKQHIKQLKAEKRYVRDVY